MICDMRGRINKYFPRGNLCSGFPLHEVIPQQSYDWLSHSASATSVKAPAPPPSFTPPFPTCLAPSAPRFPVPSGRRQKIRLPPVGLQWIFAQVSAKRDNTLTLAHPCELYTCISCFIYSRMGVSRCHARLWHAICVAGQHLNATLHP